MVTIRIIARLAVLGVACLCQCRPESNTRLCFESRDAFGQNQSTLYCGRDSCYLMQFSGDSPLEGAVGLFGFPVHRDILAKGDSLVQALMKLDIPPRQQVSGSFSVRRNDSVLSIPRTIQSDSFLVPLRHWVLSRRREVEKNPIWTDSLTLSVGGTDSREVEIRLASGPGVNSLLGEPLRLGVYHSFFSNRAAEGVPSRVQWPADSIRSWMAGSGMKYRVPQGVAAVQASLKIFSRKESPPLPDACMDGLFELETGRLRLE